MSQDLPATEDANPRTAQLDLMPARELVELLVDEQRGAVDAVARESERIAAVVETIVDRLERGGCLHYVGAGTSGRLATLDAAEIPPTFGAPPDLVRAHVAGGREALVRAIEGAEDDAESGDAAMREQARPGDAVIGLSASGSAPFVVAALERARAIGAFTVAIVNTEGSPLARAAAVAIVLHTGAEAIAGSTRLRAGTAQKIALNAISTAVMVRLGKVHGNLMVDVVATNRKLQARAVRLVCQLAGVDGARAAELLAAAGGRVKVAVVMQRRGVGAPDAIALLERHRGSLRALL
ncbi:MAG TPA: N-acetylmuramic acid 6-phosphate etherase [Verrucomicrobiae bacterium]|nr:N-acetylmuramic acid 6-phosphate etherase [Verrucomicrobiae bacterium]